MERTTYNEKGEEVTEMVYDDAEPEAEPMLIDEMVSAHFLDKRPGSSLLTSAVFLACVNKSWSVDVICDLLEMDQQHKR